MIIFIIFLIATLIVVFWEEKPIEIEKSPTSLQDEFTALLKENTKENRMTENPVSDDEVYEMTRTEFCLKYNTPNVKYYVRR